MLVPTHEDTNSVVFSAVDMMVVNIDNERQIEGCVRLLLYYFDHRFTACYMLPIQFTEVTVHSWLLPVTELNIVHDQTASIFFRHRIYL